MNRLRHLRHAAALMLLLMGCVSASVSRVPGRHYPPLDRDAPVVVYAPEVPTGMDGALPVPDPLDAEIIGTVNFDEPKSTAWNTIINRAKKEARQMGGDIVLVQRWELVPRTTTTYPPLTDAERERQRNDPLYHPEFDRSRARTMTTLHKCLWSRVLRSR